MGGNLLGALNDALAIGAYLLARRRPRRGLVVLSYRGIDPDAFSEQLRAIGIARGVKIVGLHEIDRWLDHIPRNGAHVLFTFSDAISSQLYAASELSRFGIAATFFIPVARVEPEQFDEDTIRLLTRIGHDVQPQLADHRPLAAMSADELCSELGHTLDFATRYAKPIAIAYPDDAWPSDVTRTARSTIHDRGLRLGFTSEPGHIPFRRLAHQPLLLRRTHVPRRTRALAVQAYAAGFFGPRSLFERFVAALRRPRAR